MMKDFTNWLNMRPGFVYLKAVTWTSWMNISMKI
jgi:hypothetical protein